MLLLELLRIHPVVIVVVAVVVIVVHPSEIVHPSESTHVVGAVRKIHGILLAPLLLLASTELRIAPASILSADASKGPHAPAASTGEVQVVRTTRHLWVALDGG